MFILLKWLCNSLFDDVPFELVATTLFGDDGGDGESSEIMDEL